MQQLFHRNAAKSGSDRKFHRSAIFQSLTVPVSEEKTVPILNSLRVSYKDRIFYFNLHSARDILIVSSRKQGLEATIR